MRPSIPALFASGKEGDLSLPVPRHGEAEGRGQSQARHVVSGAELEAGSPMLCFRRAVPCLVWGALLQPSEMAADGAARRSLSCASPCKSMALLPRLVAS